MALSRVVSEIINVKKYCDREIGIRGHSRSLSRLHHHFGLLDTVLQSLMSFVSGQTQQWLTMGSDILISKTKTKTRMIDFSNTETKTNTKMIMKTETIKIK